MDYEKKIDIPFGAFDSELYYQEIYIPEGFEATIENNKVILKRKKIDNERIKKALIEMVHDTTGDSLWVDYNVHKKDALAWLEKQEERLTKEEQYKNSFIEKAIEWIDYYNRNGGCEFDEWEEVFRKEMKETEE